jgi:hypothetical protein
MLLKTRIGWDLRPQNVASSDSLQDVYVNIAVMYIYM